MIRLTRSDPSRNMHRFYAMQLGNWVTNPARVRLPIWYGV
jgi:predicted DNA-binding WGR domain protein